MPAAELLGQLPDSDSDQVSMHAVIGDELRIPAVWCQLGNCISRFSEPAALGEADVRSRAISMGWREDSFGRLACPGCVQHDPTFRISYPVVPWQAQHVPPAVALLGEPLPDAADGTDLAWSGGPPLRLAMTADEPERRPAWFRHREAGRHRLTI